MSIINHSLKKQSGFTLDPNPPQAGVNYFTSESARDTYFSANPTELAKFDANTQRLILMEVDGSVYYESRYNGTWINAFAGSVGSIDLSQHNVEELANVTNAGSGIIMSADERTKLGELPTNSELEAELALKANNSATIPLANNNPAIFADGAQGKQSPYNELGWYYKNSVSELPKINWYFYGQGLASNETLADITGGYAIVTARGDGHLPFFVIYTAPLYDGNDATAWYRSRVVYHASNPTVVAGTTYLVYFGENPIEYPTLDRIELLYDASSSEGLQEDSEKLFTASLHTDSGLPNDDVEITVRVIEFSTHVRNEYLLTAIAEDVTTEQVNWMLQTDNFELPSFVYTSSTFELNSSQVIAPTILGGTTPFQSWRTVGDVPSEFVLNPENGELTITTTSEVKSGSFGIIANNYKGDSAEYTFNYTIRDAQGVTEFTNMLVPYPALRISYSPTTTAKVFLRDLNFYGELTSTSSGLLWESNHAVYHADNGDGTWDYLINVDSSAYWYLFRDCETDPSTLASGLTTDITTSKDYDLVSPNEDDVTVEGKIYPSDQTDVHHLTSFRYMHLGVDASLDGFMADDTHWSYGFKLIDAIPKDGLGRTMFTREGRNWLAFYIAHNGTYTNMIFGNGSNSSYDGDDAYLGQLDENTWITVTCQNGNVKIFADTTQIFSYNGIVKRLQIVSM